VYGEPETPATVLLRTGAHLCSGFGLCSALVWQRQ
jgi:hypothetical protein